MKILWIILVISALLFGCSAPIVYDDYIDSFRYKPESEWDYVKDLGPYDTPISPTGDQ